MFAKSQSVELVNSPSINRFDRFYSHTQRALYTRLESKGADPRQVSEIVRTTREHDPNTALHSRKRPSDAQSRPGSIPFLSPQAPHDPSLLDDSISSRAVAGSLHLPLPSPASPLGMSCEETPPRHEWIQQTNPGEQIECIVSPSPHHPHASFSYSASLSNSNPSHDTLRPWLTGAGGCVSLPDRSALVRGVGVHACEDTCGAHRSPLLETSGSDNLERNVEIDANEPGQFTVLLSIEALICPSSKSNHTGMDSPRERILKANRTRNACAGMYLVRWWVRCRNHLAASASIPRSLAEQQWDEAHNTTTTTTTTTSEDRWYQDMMVAHGSTPSRPANPNHPVISFGTAVSFTLPTFPTLKATDGSDRPGNVPSVTVATTPTTARSGGTQGLESSMKGQDRATPRTPMGTQSAAPCTYTLHFSVEQQSRGKDPAVAMDHSSPPSQNVRGRYRVDLTRLLFSKDTRGHVQAVAMPPRRLTLTVERPHSKTRRNQTFVSRVPPSFQIDTHPDPSLIVLLAARPYQAGDQDRPAQHLLHDTAARFRMSPMSSHYKAPPDLHHIHSTQSGVDETLRFHRSVSVDQNGSEIHQRTGTERDVESTDLFQGKAAEQRNSTPRLSSARVPIPILHFPSSSYLPSALAAPNTDRGTSTRPTPYPFTSPRELFRALSVSPTVDRSTSLEKAHFDHMNRFSLTSASQIARGTSVIPSLRCSVPVSRTDSTTRHRTTSVPDRPQSIVHPLQVVGTSPNRTLPLPLYRRVSTDANRRTSSAPSIARSWKHRVTTVGAPLHGGECAPHRIPQNVLSWSTNSKKTLAKSCKASTTAALEQERVTCVSPRPTVSHRTNLRRLNHTACTTNVRSRKQSTARGGHIVVLSSTVSKSKRAAHHTPTHWPLPGHHHSAQPSLPHSRKSGRTAMTEREAREAPVSNQKPLETSSRKNSTQRTEVNRSPSCEEQPGVSSRTMDVTPQLDAGDTRASSDYQYQGTRGKKPDLAEQDILFRTSGNGISTVHSFGGDGFCNEAIQPLISPESCSSKDAVEASVDTQATTKPSYEVNQSAPGAEATLDLNAEREQALLDMITSLREEVRILSNSTETSEKNKDTTLSSSREQSLLDRIASLTDEVQAKNERIRILEGHEVLLHNKNLMLTQENVLLNEQTRAVERLLHNVLEAHKNETLDKASKRIDAATSTIDHTDPQERVSLLPGAHDCDPRRPHRASLPLTTPFPSEPFYGEGEDGIVPSSSTRTRLPTLDVHSSLFRLPTDINGPDRDEDDDLHNWDFFSPTN